MRKIASPQALQTELRQLLAYCESDLPSRSFLAAHLQALANRMVGEDVRTARLELSGSVDPLYDHTSEATAYVVDNYPYGRFRTQKRFWLESGSKGWRMAGQTLDPKTQRWNAPKRSTYMEWAGNMYLDSQKHVQWAGLGVYSGIEDFEKFVKNFPQSDFHVVKKIIPAQIRKLEGYINKTLVWTVNDVRKDFSEQEQKEHAEELKKWEALQKKVH